jgi:hypothetical protein
VLAYLFGINDMGKTEGKVFQGGEVEFPVGSSCGIGHKENR